MMQMTIEKGDIIALKDGREVEVLSIRMDGDRMLRFDYLDRREASPMRKTEYPSAIVRLLRKNARKPFDPKAQQAYDDPKNKPQEVIVINGQEYAKTGKVVPVGPEIINQEAGPQVHAAVKNKPTPITSRNKEVGKSK